MPRDVLRVVHLPARTPFVRKLSSETFRIVNGSRIASGEKVPAEVSAAWMLARRPFDWFDVVHLHHIEFEPVAELEQLLDACRAESKRVVFTAHDVRAMFSSDDQLAQRFRLLAEAEAAWIFLTPGSVRPVKELVPSLIGWQVIPHGFVVDPDFLAERENHVAYCSALHALRISASKPRSHLHHCQLESRSTRRRQPPSAHAPRL